VAEVTVTWDRTGFDTDTGVPRVRVEMAASISGAEVHTLHQDVEVADLNDADGVEEAIQAVARKYAQDIAARFLPAQPAAVPEVLADDVAHGSLTVSGDDLIPQPAESV